MQSFPHHYHISVSSSPEENVIIQSESLSDLVTAAPVEFGGPGDKWSPETLLTAALGDCFILSFKAIARASHFDWLSLSCEVEGLLDRVEKITQFTGFTIKATLKVAEGVSKEKAEKLLEKAEASCLVSNSLKAKSHLQVEIKTV
jgi:organic hydroperoxide reductase OsmC/OhrA